jgi:LPS export ABC transporter permease LptG/LPS export ABC transporter permease LptF
VLLRIRKLDWYVVREVLGPLTLGFLVYTFLLLMQFLFRSADMIIRREVPAAQVGKLLLFTLPNIVVLTIPMALLFAVLVAIGRLAADSELVAMRSSGISLFALARPVLLVSALLTLLNGVLMIGALPRGNNALQHLRIDILGSSVTRQVEPRVFYQDWEGLVLYIFEAPQESPYWEGVFVAEDLPTNENQVTVAERGQVRLDEAGDRLVLHLENAVIHKMDFRTPHKYHTTVISSLDRVLVDEYTSQQRNQARTSKGVREQTLTELNEQLDNPALSKELRLATEIEIHKKFSIPAACFVFGLLALPLAYRTGRGSRSSGFALSIAVILLYYILLTNGEETARVGKLEPWIAMWLPNFVLGAFGLYLLVRRNSDRSVLLGGLDRWLRKRPWLNPRNWRRSGSHPTEDLSTRGMREASSSGGDGPHVVLRLPRLRIRFPNILDRYVIRQFSTVFGLVVLSGLAVYIVADMADRMDDILKNDVGFGVVGTYYKYLTLQIIFEIAPIAVLVTTLIIFGILSKSNEVTAAKALGISLFRIAIPALFAALVVVAFTGFLEARILPAANARVAQADDIIKGRTAARSYRRADRQWLFGQGRYIYNYLRYDSEKQALSRLQVFEFDDDDRFTRRLFADNAEYLGDAWLFEIGWVRSFDGGEVLDFRTFDQPVIDYYPETPDYFESEYKLPKAMSYGELKDYISELEGSGQAAPELQVELHKKVALPFASLVMSLVALPFSFRLGRKGTLYGIGIGVVLGMVFFALLAFSSTLGETGALPPRLAVWSPSIAFMILSVYLMLGVRS